MRLVRVVVLLAAAILFCGGCAFVIGSGSATAHDDQILSGTNKVTTIGVHLK